MTLQQLTAVKRWHTSHHREGSLELQVWDAVLIAWIMGWVGVLPALVLAPRAVLLLCGALFCLPGGYVALRRRLHRKGRLRCDWLASARAA